MLSAEAYAAVVYRTAAALGGSLVDHDDDTTRRPRRVAPLPIETGPCSWCRRPGVGITADRLVHCAAHMWPPYRGSAR